MALAVQLCALRFLGFVPEELAGIPEPALRFLCEQTETEPHELLAYGERPQTRSAHFALVREQLDFHPWEPGRAAALGVWLAERALEHERPSVLMSLACEHLRARRIVRPSITALARMIGAARESSHEVVLERLSSQLGPRRCVELDGLLEVDPARKVSEIAWLRTPIGRVGIQGALAQVAKYARLRELAADGVDLSSLPPGRRRQLAAQARRLDAQQLTRRTTGPVDGPLRRHPILLVALAELHLERGDELLDVFCILLAGARRRAKTAVDRARRESARTRDELAELASSLSRILLEEKAAGRNPTARVLREVGVSRLRDAAAITRDTLPSLEQEQLDVLHKSHSSLTRAMTAILDTVQLQAHPAELARIPEIELADLLIEVDAWTSFTDELRHVAGATPRADQLPERLYAAVVASGTLLGPVAMARICELSYRQIAWAQEWYLDVENVGAASRRITDYHHRLELTQHLGSGHFSSSDGHRVGQRGKPPTAAMLAREFGHHHGGLTVMSWTLDDYSTYGAKIVSVSDREATHSLDAIVHAEAPDIREHTTDTHGYTDIVFGLFDLLGIRFLPRLRDLPDQRLYRLGPARPDLAVDVARRGKIRAELIYDRWDELLRVAGSLKRGWITPSLLISRLQAQSPKGPLAAALQEYGRLVKTNFALGYHADPLQQRRITAMLNKGETTNTLRRRIAFANRNELRHDADPGQHAACLTLILNAIIVWNTRYIQAALDAIRQARPELVTDQTLARVAPVLHAHINPYGRYRFDLTGAPDPGQLRPLNAAPASAPNDVPTPPIPVNRD